MDDVEATVYVNGTMETRSLTIDHVMDDYATGGPKALGRIYIDHRLSLELSKQNLAALIDRLSELEL